MRAMVDLALHSGQHPILRRDIAARQGLSAAYVAQLFRELRAAGLVDAVKGPGGGYLLARDPETIRVGEIVRAVEGPIVSADCCDPAGQVTCERIGTCATYPLWKRLGETMAEYLDSVTLSDLCDEALPLQ